MGHEIKADGVCVVCVCVCVCVRVVSLIFLLETDLPLEVIGESPEHTHRAHARGLFRAICVICVVTSRLEIQKRPPPRWERASTEMEMTMIRRRAS